MENIKKMLVTILLLAAITVLKAQSINYIKFKNNTEYNTYKMITNRVYNIKLKPYLIPYFPDSLINLNHPTFGIKLKLVGCKKDSLLFKGGISIPIYAIERIDRVKRVTEINSILLAINLSIIGVVNYYTISKYHHFTPIVFSNLPFILAGTALLADMPGKKKEFYISDWTLEEYRFYDSKLDTIFYYNLNKKNSSNKKDKEN